MSNYIDDLATRIGRLCDLAMVGAEADLLRIYAVLGLAKGWNVRDQDVHDAWSAWTASRNPGHPSLIPFEDLADEVKALDAKYTNAIRAMLAATRRAGSSLNFWRRSMAWADKDTGVARVMLPGGLRYREMVVEGKDMVLWLYNDNYYYTVELHQDGAYTITRYDRRGWPDHD